MPKVTAEQKQQKKQKKSFSIFKNNQWHIENSNLMLTVYIYQLR